MPQGWHSDLDVVSLCGFSAAEHVVETREDIFREMNAFARLRNPSESDGAYAIEDIGVTVVEPNLMTRHCFRFPPFRVDRASHVSGLSLKFR